MSEMRQAIRVSASVVSALAVVAGLGGLMLSSCGKDDGKKSDPGPTTSPSPSPSPSSSPAAALTFADVTPVLNTSCAGSSCHATPGSSAGKTSPSLATEAAVKSAAAGALGEIKIAGTAGGMPPTSTTAFDTTTDGKKLKTYLSGL